MVPGEAADLLQQRRALLRDGTAVDQGGPLFTGDQAYAHPVGLEDTEVDGGAHGLPRTDGRLVHGPRLQLRAGSSGVLYTGTRMLRVPMRR